MGGNEEERARPFSVVPIVRTRGNGHKLKCKKLHLTTGKHTFTVRLVKRWNGLSRQVVESPSMDVFQTQVDVILGNLL